VSPASLISSGRGREKLGGAAGLLPPLNSHVRFWSLKYMTAIPRERSDKPNDPPSGGGEDEGPKDDWREPGGDVKEPPPPGTTPNEEKFPRKGEL
jgi:hypothetical protein